MGAVPKLIALLKKMNTFFFFVVLPATLRLTYLSLYLLFKSYKHSTTMRKYMVEINKKSSKFVFGSEFEPENFDYCVICLSEFQEGEKGRRLVECNHVFHGDCIEKWLHGNQATCPLCRKLVVPEEMVEERQEVEHMQADVSFEEELALMLLSAMPRAGCHECYWLL